jgi:type IV pilus assembly protein PilC
MPTFTYEALDDNGDRVDGNVKASTKQEAIDKVHNMGYVPTEVAQTEDQVAGGGTDADEEEGWFSWANMSFGGVSSQELTQFTSQLATLINAGLPIVRSLKILTNQMKASQLKTISEQISEDVEQGSSLSEAMSKHPKAFSGLYVNMIKAGEAGGVLDTILQRLAEYMEKAQEMKRKVLSASIYPAAVLSFAVLVVICIMYFIIPRFKKIFDQLAGGELPTVTQYLLGFSNFIASGGWALVLVVPIAFWGVLKIVRMSKAGRTYLDRLKLNLPVVGDLYRKTITTRFCRTFGTLTSSGVPILDALQIVRGSIKNEVVNEAIGEVHESIRGGETIAEPLQQTEVFDDIVVNMIDVGEETGELDEMLLKIADTYEDQVDAAVDGLMSLLEPALIILMGLIIGFIVVALFLPLISIMNQLQ